MPRTWGGTVACVLLCSQYSNYITSHGADSAATSVKDIPAISCNDLTAPDLVLTLARIHFAKGVILDSHSSNRTVFLEATSLMQKSVRNWRCMLPIYDAHVSAFVHLRPMNRDRDIIRRRRTAVFRHT